MTTTTAAPHVRIKLEEDEQQDYTVNTPTAPSSPFPPNCPVLCYRPSLLLAAGRIVESQRETCRIQIQDSSIVEAPIDQVQFAPTCCVWVLPWKKSTKWKRAKVLGSVQIDQHCYYSVCETTPSKTLVHHGIPLERIKYDESSSCPSRSDKIGSAGAITSSNTEIVSNKKISIKQEPSESQTAVQDTASSTTHLSLQSPSKNVEPTANTTMNNSTGVTNDLAAANHASATGSERNDTQSRVQTLTRGDATTAEVPSRTASRQGNTDASTSIYDNSGRAASLPPNLVSPDKDRVLVGSNLKRPLENSVVLSKRQKIVDEELASPRRNQMPPLPNIDNSTVVRRQSPESRTIVLPSWLDNQRDLVDFLIGTGGRNHKLLVKKMQCSVHIDKSSIPWRIRLSRFNHCDSVNIAMHALERVLSEICSPRQQSLLVYDMAEINGHGEHHRVGRLLFIRRLFKNAQLWMCKILMPADFPKFSGLFVGRKGSGIHPILKETKCQFDMPAQAGCGVVRGADLHRVEKCVERLRKQLRFAETRYYESGL